MTLFPEKASEMIRMALVDMKAQIEKGTEIDMDVWVNYDKGVCSACLAGTVMLEKLSGSMGLRLLDEGVEYSVPWLLKISERNRNKIESLDYFARGNLFRGLEMFHREGLSINANESDLLKYRKLNEDYHKFDDKYITCFHTNPSQFFSDMEESASYLEKEGY